MIPINKQKVQEKLKSWKKIEKIKQVNAAKISRTINITPQSIAGKIVRIRTKRRTSNDKTMLNRN